jgi:hypothetical protein
MAGRMQRPDIEGWCWRTPHELSQAWASGSSSLLKPKPLVLPVPAFDFLFADFLFSATGNR